MNRREAHCQLGSEPLFCLIFESIAELLLLLSVDAGEVKPERAFVGAVDGAGFDQDLLIQELVKDIGIILRDPQVETAFGGREPPVGSILPEDGGDLITAMG